LAEAGRRLAAVTAERDQLAGVRAEAESLRNRLTAAERQAQAAGAGATRLAELTRQVEMLTADRDRLAGTQRDSAGAQAAVVQAREALAEAEKSEWGPEAREFFDFIKTRIRTWLRLGKNASVVPGNEVIFFTTESHRVASMLSPTPVTTRVFFKIVSFSSRDFVASVGNIKRVIMLFISWGTPGTTKKSQLRSRKCWPAAVPQSLSIRVAPLKSIACFLLFSLMTLFLCLKKASTFDIQSKSYSSGIEK
jgi:hypothetical protein